MVNQMKIKKNTTIPRLSGLSLLFCLGAATAQAQFAAGTEILNEDFTGGNGTFPTDWFNSSGGATGDFTRDTVEIQSNALFMARPASNDTGAPRNIGYTGSFSGTPATDWEDYTVETLWSESRQDASSHTTGLLARWQGTGTSDRFDGYFAYEDGGVLRIGRDFDVSDQTSADTVLASTSLTRTPSNDEVTRLEFTVDGDSLTAEMFEEDGNTGNYTISMGSVSATDSTYSTGSVGMRAYFSFRQRDATFDDVIVTAIPEPSAYAVIGGLLAVGAVLLRRRTR